MPAPRKSLGNRRWRKIRALQLQKEPLCRLCLAQGAGTPAEEVDHIDRKQPDNHGWDNLQSLCKPCHSSKTWHETHGLKRNSVDVNGFVTGWK